MTKLTGAEEAQAQRDFYQAFGLVMAQWARLESCMFYWFMYAIDKPEAIARAIFFSAKSFTGRRDMFNGAIPHSPFDDDIKMFLKAASKKARQYSEFRNRVAHGEPTWNLKKNSPIFKQYSLCEARITRGAMTVMTDEALEISMVTNAQMETATHNLRELVRLMWDLHPRYRDDYPDADPKAYRLLVLQLPNRAHSKEPAQIRGEPQTHPDDPEE